MYVVLWCSLAHAARMLQAKGKWFNPFEIQRPALVKALLVHLPLVKFITITTMDLYPLKHVSVIHIHIIQAPIFVKN